MRQVVVGFDGSAGAVTALRWGVQEAQLHGVRLVAFAAVDPAPPAPARQPLTAGGGEALLASLRDDVQKITASCPAVFQHGNGAAAHQLVAACQSEDVLVVGSRGRSPFAGLLLGSVSRACLKVAPCPVVVVRERAEPSGPFGRVIVGVDASEHSRRALRMAAREARVHGSALHAIHAVHWDHLGVELVAPTPHSAGVRISSRVNCPTAGWRRGRSSSTVTLRTCWSGTADTPICWCWAPGGTPRWRGCCWGRPATTAPGTRRVR